MKKELKETWPKDDKFGPCIEDIFAEMLNRGMTLCVTDPEGKDHDFTIYDIENGIENMLMKASSAFADYINGNNDACSGSNLIDCCIFGKPVYG